MQATIIGAQDYTGTDYYTINAPYALEQPAAGIQCKDPCRTERTECLSNDDGSFSQNSKMSRTTSTLALLHQHYLQQECQSSLYVIMTLLQGRCSSCSIKSHGNQLLHSLR